MFRFLLVLTFLFWINFGFSRTMPKQLPANDTFQPAVALESDSIISDTITDSIAGQELDSPVVKPNKSKEDDVDKESVGYKVGYQIGSWLIPGLLMVIVTILIVKRSRRK